jgi:hypothetical protein
MSSRSNSLHSRSSRSRRVVLADHAVAIADVIAHLRRGQRQRDYGRQPHAIARCLF